MTFPHCATEADPVVHDPIALERLREIDADGTLVRKWIHSFLNETPERLRGMRSATEAEMYPAVSAAAHTLKNVSGWLGGERFWIACQALELAARRASKDECRSHLRVLGEELPLFAVCLESYLDTNA